MAKRQREETTTALVVPDKLSPAAVVGFSTRVNIPKSMLPEEFGGVELETVETGFDPTVKWSKPGDFVAGIYEGMETNVGPNKSNLYTFNAKGKTFGVWGTTVLDRGMSKALSTGAVKPGYMVAIIYAGDIETDFQPCKMFNIQVARKG